MADERKNYYIGLDIGTDSVGYAVTDEYYMPMKKGGEPLFGVMTFEAASTSADRRAFRTARRRLDRRQQRVELINEIFAAEIGKKDPEFFIRRAESALFREEAEEPYTLFNDPGFTDKEYHKAYPTIHHLLKELIKNKEPHDVRLVYLACAWLVANRGHFLFDVPADNTQELLDFTNVYNKFLAYFSDNGYSLPWDEGVEGETILEILKMNTGVTRKKEAFKEKIYGGKKIPKEPDEACPFSREAIVALLSGGKSKPEEMFRTGEFTETESVSLNMPDEDFARVMSELGDSSEIYSLLRAMHDCALLIVAQHGKDTVSEAKVEVYEQHKADLAGLKKFIKKYAPEKYNEIFKLAGNENYVAYSYNVRSCRNRQEVKKADKEKFSDYLKKIVKGIEPLEEDRAFYEDMLNRLETRTFLPKQKDTDNRVIPQQLYRHELKLILDNAGGYLPMLSRKDETGLTAKEKILSIFDFRIPYFVGPLNRSGSHAWIERKAEGKIYPWNFTDLVDLDKSEEAFIRRMTNKCTYIAGADVLPANSLLYCKFSVLNEINNLKVNGHEIPVEVKQNIYTDVIAPAKAAHVSQKMIRDYLLSRGLIEKTDTVSGTDIKLTSSLAPVQKFSRLLGNRILTEEDAEKIILRSAYSEDRSRFSGWLKANYPQLNEEDIRYIVRLNLKEFGRLSGEFLTGIYGTDKNGGTGEAFTILDALWNTNNNLMQLLSDRFTFRETIERRNREYYAEHPVSLSDRLDEMYISNAVRRPIFRTLDICADIVGSMGYVPEKIFVEMARDVSDNSRGRSVTRKQQLLDLYKSIRSTEARELEKELAAMGEMADNRLQSDKLFLYYLQMGKCAYSGEPIDLKRLAEGTFYNIDHIYPQRYVKDDGILNNKVLVLSTVNGLKKDELVPEDIRRKMRPVWETWKNVGLITEEKFRRLTRNTPFTEEEKWGFINRQLVETRQSTKAVAQLLAERYGSRIIYVKAGLVSEFRQEFDLLKSRQVNDFHHAKDAYLNIVVGNVYDSRFSRQWFSPKEQYSVNTKALFANPVKCGSRTVWQGKSDIAKVKEIARKNHIHMARYVFCRNGGLFDQQPVKASAGLVPLKAGMDPEKYGGYNKPTASFFYLVKYTIGKKTDVIFMPVELAEAEKCKADPEYAKEYAGRTISGKKGKTISSAEILLNNRPIKINSILEADGLRLYITGKSKGGQEITVSLCNQLILSGKQEVYVKALESFKEKRAKNACILPDEEHDHISKEANMNLYDALLEKMQARIYSLCPGNQAQTLADGRAKFENLSLADQISCLLNILSWFGNTSGGCDFSAVGGSKQGGSKHPTSTLSSWAKKYQTLYLIDQSAAGIREKRSVNLLELL